MPCLLHHILLPSAHGLDRESVHAAHISHYNLCILCHWFCSRLPQHCTTAPKKASNKSNPTKEALISLSFKCPRQRTKSQLPTDTGTYIQTAPPPYPVRCSLKSRSMRTKRKRSCAWAHTPSTKPKSKQAAHPPGSPLPLSPVLCLSFTHTAAAAAAAGTHTLPLSPSLCGCCVVQQARLVHGCIRHALSTNRSSTFQQHQLRRSTFSN